MAKTNRPIVSAVAITAVMLVLAAYLILPELKRTQTTGSWQPAFEGFLAVPTPCCTKASLWNDLQTVTPDEQRARPASAVEAAEWLNEWPYRSPDASEMPNDTAQLEFAARNSEVRCVGEPSGPEIRPNGDDAETMRGIHFRRECTFTKWQVWAWETAEKPPNERHTVWVDEDGFFHGLVDYWK